jgi:RND family efflux transporter MFP subunit
VKISENKLKVILPFAILTVGALIAVVMIKSRAPVPTRPTVEYAPLVRVVEVQPQELRLMVHTQGTVKARTETNLVAEVAGTIVKVFRGFAAGGFFEEGDVLAEIDASDYRVAVATAEGTVAQARVRLETEQAQGEVAREEWSQLGTGGDSPLATRELQLQEAQAALAAAEAMLEKARRDLARTRIRAPFAGRIRTKLADLGEYVAPGVPVADVYSVDFAEVRLPVPDADLAFLDLPVDYRGAAAQEPGPEVVLYADFAGRRHSWNGRIVRVEGEIDRVSRMVNVVAQVEDPYGKHNGDDPLPLAVGMFVEAEIVGSLVANAITVPRTALRGGSVLIVDEEDRLRFRDVDVLRVERGYAVVVGGLNAGDRVCVSTLEAVSDGMKVRPAHPPAGEPAHPPAGEPAGADSATGDAPAEQPPAVNETETTTAGGTK